MVDSQGWVKLHRSILEWEWYSDINTKVLFLHLLLKSNHKDKKFQGMTVKRGQVVTGLSILSLETSLSVQRLRTSLNKLKSTNEITIETSTKGTVITIVNYDFYQISDDDQQAEQQTSNKRSTSEQQTSNKRSTSEQQTSNKRSTTNKNVKKYKNVKNDKNNTLLSKIEISDLEEDEKLFFEIAVAYQKLFIKNLQEKKSPTKNQEKATFKNYVDPVRLMMQNDGVTKDQLTDVWKFLGSAAGEFWKPNILSTKKLREKFPQLILKAREKQTTHSEQKKTVEEIAQEVIFKKYGKQAYES